MDDKEIQKKAKKQLRNLEVYVNSLQRSIKAVEILRTHAVKRALHKRAIAATKALDGLYDLVSDLRDGQSLCMEILGAKKLTIDNQDRPKLKLIPGGK